MHATTHKVLNERQTVYHLSPAFEYYGERHEYVVASLSITWGTDVGSWLGGYPSECLVFPSDGEGISDLGEVGGSYECPGGHAEALRGMGYTLDGERESDFPSELDDPDFYRPGGPMERG